ncbi:MAG: hypothetical protein KDI65_12490, partial [Alphaproteobacteria bacterium]|nr:hypothetical protein [Alphaproteobacteria bacterium]
MTDETKNKFVLPFPLLTLVAGIYIAFWSKLYLNFYLNTDFGWLFTCLQRYLAGGTYATDFYETNPPLSFLLYLPAYLLYSTLGVFPSIGILIYFAIINVLVAVIILKYMRLYDFPATMKAGVIFSLIFVTTWLTNASYGQKDHLIFLLFLPYTLMHVGIIASRTIPKNLIIITSILGGLAVCIKPHYLLIPATFYLYRLVANRNLLKIILSIDFVAFVLTGLVYLAFIYMCFPDYFNIILPEVLEYYGEDKPLPVTPHLSFMVLSVTAFLILLFVQETEQTKFLRLTVFALIGLSILSAIAYYAQNKGFYYHTIPFFGYAAMAFILALFGLIYYSSRILEASIIVPVVVIFLITHTFMTGFPPGFLSTKEFRD